MRYVPAAVLYIHFRTLQHVEWTASDTNHAPYVSMSRTFWCDYAFLLEENNFFFFTGVCDPQLSHAWIPILANYKDISDFNNKRKDGNEQIHC